MSKKYWITFFSQSGQEIALLANELNRTPDLIVTNNFNMEKYHPSMTELIKKVPFFMSSHDKIMALGKQKNNIFPADSVITLHGYLRIISSEFCNTYNVYNGHPGLITMYPDLKGKDPQIRLYNNIHNYNYMGSVVHVCTPELDGGEVVTNSCEMIDHQERYPLKDVYDKLRRHSLQAWKAFLKDVL